MELPMGVRKSLGSQSIQKGDIAGQLRFYAWDALAPCQGRNCPAYLTCTFSCKDDADFAIEKREEGIEMDIPSCGIMQNYLESVTTTIFRNYAQDLNEAQLYRVGMGLIPMYRQLCRLKIEELGLPSILYTTIKGTPQVHPIIGEIRAQIMTIEKMWHTIGLNKLDDLDSVPKGNAYDNMDKEARENLPSNTDK